MSAPASISGSCFSNRSGTLTSSASIRATISCSQAASPASRAGPRPTFSAHHDVVDRHRAGPRPARAIAAAELRRAPARPGRAPPGRDAGSASCDAGGERLAQEVRVVAAAHVLSSRRERLARRERPRLARLVRRPARLASTSPLGRGRAAGRRAGPGRSAAAQRAAVRRARRRCAPSGARSSRRTAPSRPGSGPRERVNSQTLLRTS